MKRLLVAILFVLAFASSAHSQISTAQIPELMPLEKDHTSMWWRDGFAGIIDGAAWRRMTKTGNYWFLFDSDSVKIPRLGPTSKPLDEIDGVELKLKIEVDGESYFCEKGSEWTRFKGPRLIESGRFLQRTDVRGLVFSAKDGKVLNAESRFETAAWSDQLGLTLSVRPGKRPYKSGTGSQGRVAGGFGLTGKNRFDVEAKDCQASKAFTIAFWAFASSDYQAGRNAPWLVCQNRNETVDGNFGILLYNNCIPVVALNVGGGNGENKHRFTAPPYDALKIDQWNHLVLSYDNDIVRLFVNGRVAVEEKIGKPRNAPPGGLALGGRQDGSKGFPFRGVIDEVMLFDRGLTPQEVRRLRTAPNKNHDAALKPLQKWTFNSDLPAMQEAQRESWSKAVLEVSLGTGKDAIKSKWESPSGSIWNSKLWENASLTLDPSTMKKVSSQVPTKVIASDKGSNQALKVTFDPDIGCHRVNLDTTQPITPKGTLHPPNDVIERTRIVLTNQTKQPQIVRLMFEKTPKGFRQAKGQAITGISAVLRDPDGNPTGIPVQLSKNWHTHSDGGTHSGMWFHGISQVRLPPDQKTELEFTMVYGHWGGVAAASHAQLSLIGYGSNHLWEQSAIGAWGESICYNPEQVYGKCVVTDIRPLMVKSMKDEKKWGWTHNVGGADFLRMFDVKGKRVVHASVRSSYEKTGPCLTDVRYAGSIGKTGAQHRIHSSISRTDDIIRATYRIRMYATKPVDFSRFVIFQAGSDNYAYSEEGKMAVGNAKGLKKDWLTQRGGDVYRGQPIECTQPNPWASLHATVDDPAKEKGGWATRGVIIRKWNAKLGGKTAKPWFAERGTDLGRRAVSTIDIVPPPGVKRLEVGDFVEATIEFVVLPQYASDYYGPNESLRTSLKKNQDTWKMVHREAALGSLNVQVPTGKLENTYPGVTIAAENDQASITLKGGVGYVPITFTNLTSHSGFALTIDGKRLDQKVHGKDFWQTDYDSKTKRWSQTYNVPANETKPINIKFGRPR